VTTTDWYTPPGGVPFLDAVPNVRVADAEQAKSTGGCLMLYPTQEDAINLAIPGGEPVEDLHVTLLYFGEDVTDRPGADQEIANVVGGIADQFSVITARVFGHAVFNPDAANGREPCAVYLLGNSHDLDDLHDQLVDAVGQIWDCSEQHAPWIPHLTAGYSISPDQLGFTGDIQLDRIGLSWMGNTTWFPLG
jgi:hypothetical protein